MTQHARSYIISSTRNSTQTEAHIFSYLTEICHISRDVVDAAIDALLDEGVIKSTIIDARTSGFGYLPALCASL